MPSPQDQNGGNDRPGDFQRRVAVGLGRERVARLAAVADGRVKQRPFHQDEYHYHGPEQHVEQQELFTGYRAVGSVQGPWR